MTTHVPVKVLREHPYMAENAQGDLIMAKELLGTGIAINWTRPAFHSLPADAEELKKYLNIELTAGTPDEMLIYRVPEVNAYWITGPGVYELLEMIKVQYPNLPSDEVGRKLLHAQGEVQQRLAKLERIAVVYHFSIQGKPQEEILHAYIKK